MKWRTFIEGPIVNDEALISKAMAILGAKGGRTTGATKARDSKKMRAAALVRWKKVRRKGGAK